MQAIVSDMTPDLEFDRTDVLNRRHVLAMESLFRNRDHRSIQFAQARCVGCWTERLIEDRYCMTCGADFRGPAYAVLLARFPPVVNPALRTEWSTVQAKAIRSLFSTLGIRGVSVTKGRGTASHYVTVYLPRDEHPRNVGDEPTDQYGYHDISDCPRCLITRLAEKKATALILAAFPDLGDRSDYQSDYFDFVFSVYSR